MKNKDVTMIIPIKGSDFKYVERLIPLVKKNIAPKKIIVISTGDIKDKCQSIGVNFLNEDNVFNGLTFQTLKTRLIQLNIDEQSCGWYMQQFLKLAFSYVCQTKYYVCWDADMLPLRKINLFDNDGKPYFTLKKEYVQRYFVTLKKLLHIEKIRKESFIAEHMVFDVDIVHDLIKEICKNINEGSSFWEKILFSTLPESKYNAWAFSEFETYGTFVQKKYNNIYNTRTLKMLRHAKYYLGDNPSDSDLDYFAKYFDTISLEHFDDQIISTKWLNIAKVIMPCFFYVKLTYLFMNKFYKNKLKEFDWFFGNKTMIDYQKKQQIKIVYDADILNNFDLKGSGRTGIYWCAFNILKELASRKDLKVFLYSNQLSKTRKFIQFYKKTIKNISIYDGNIKHMDVFFSPVNLIPDRIKNTGIYCCTILHDCIPLIFPKYFDASIGWFHELVNSFSNRDLCFSNSNHTKKDFLKYCPMLVEHNITTIPLSSSLDLSSCTDPIKIKEVKEKYNIPQNKKYLFSLCSLEPRKNLIRSVKTFIDFIIKNKIDDLVFVLGGSAWGGFIEKFEKEVPNYQKYKDKIIRAGYVDDEDLGILYSNAEWFVYTSQYEGFGMPPLEAMKCGCAVITSNNSSLPEVIGDAGIMIDWDSDEQHIKAYEKYYFDKNYRDEMRRRGLERSKQFSWKKAADIIASTLKNLDYSHSKKSLFLRNKQEVSCNFVDVCLFKIIPFLTIKKTENKLKLFLFKYFPIFSFKNKDNKKIWKFLGIPFFKIRITNKGKSIKYYILNANILMISKKI